MKFFWFTVQTGLFHDAPPTSNYYAYQIRAEHRAEVEEIAARQTLGTGGLQVSTADLMRLEELDQSRDRSVGRSNRLPR
jgi:hypothetical protein